MDLIINNNALHIASSLGNLDAVKYLKYHGVDLDAKDVNNKTSLYIALENNNYNIFTYLVENNANLNITNTDDEITILHYVVVKNNFVLVKYLLNKGADPNIKSKRNSLPIQTASYNGRNNIVNILLSYNSFVPTISLYHTTLNYDYEMMKSLASHILPNFLNSPNNINKLHVAAIAGLYHFIEPFLNDHNISETDDRKNTALHYACIGGNLEIARLLIFLGSNINARNYEYESPFMLSVRYSHIDLVNYFLDCGQDINQVNIYKETPLHVALKNKRTDIIKALLNNNIIISNSSLIKNEFFNIQRNE